MEEESNKNIQIKELNLKKTELSINIRSCVSSLMVSQ